MVSCLQILCFWNVEPQSLDHKKRMQVLLVQDVFHHPHCLDASIRVILTVQPNNISTYRIQVSG